MPPRKKKVSTEYSSSDTNNYYYSNSSSEYYNSGSEKSKKKNTKTKTDESTLSQNSKSESFTNSTRSKSTNKTSETSQTPIKKNKNSKPKKVTKKKPESSFESTRGSVELKNKKKTKKKSSSESNKSSETKSSKKSTETERPVDLLGVILKERYMVLKNLGDGKFGVVWLCYDFNIQRVVCIKIYKSGKKYSREGESEINYLKKIKDYNCKYVIKLIDSFIIETDRGEHLCFVIPCMAASLYDIVKHKHGLPLKTVKIITAQILEGLHLIHRKGKFVHMDIKPDNIMLAGVSNNINDFLTKFEQIDLKDLFFKCRKKILLDMNAPDVSGKKQKKRKTKNDEKIFINKLYETASKIIIKYLYPNGSSMYKNDNLREKEESDSHTKVNKKYIINPSISIIDFGSCRPLKERKYHSNRTDYFLSPEDIVEYPNKNETCDIWALGCSIYELLTGEVLFDPDDDNKKISKESSQLYEMQKALGPMPKHIIDKSKKSKKFYNSDGILLGFKIFETCSLSSRLKKSGINDSDILKITKFLSPMLDYDPMKRPNAKECFENLKYLN